MTQIRIPADRGLTFRIVVTLLLVVALYAGVITFFALLNPGVLLPGAILLLVMAGLHWAARPTMLRRLGAKKITDRDTAPELYGVVERLCALADIRPPTLMIVEKDVPNALLLGRNLCVTRGLLRRLTVQELEAVVAHELGHLRHRDGLILETAGLIGLAFLVHDPEPPRRSKRQRFSDICGVIAMWPFIVVFGWIPLLARLITLFLSRARELAADRAAAVLTGNPSALASALVKLADETSAIPARDLREIQAYNAVLCVQIPVERRWLSISRWIPTHPPLRRRLDRLSRISADLSR